MSHLPEWTLVILRSVFILIILFAITKWLGKRQISQLSFFEYIAGMTIGDIAAQVSTGLDSKFFHGVFAILIFAVVPFFTGILSLKNKTARDFFEGKSTVLIKDGKILEDNLKKEKYTSDELLELLRGKNAFSVADVEFAVLEPSGELNVLLKKDRQPLTAKDISLKVPNEKEPQTVIMDGNVLDEPLSASGHNRAWLHSELEKLGVVIENVFLGQVDSYGQLTIDIYNDKLQMPSPQNKPLLLASLKKCNADLELFSLETKSKSASDMYSKNAKQIEKILNKVTYLLKE
ncbi:DUF421 domain-containing protein [Bacillus mycoides]|jgi:uncharacterized membrane protein YcaP (DUF421 family)|uniref:DUF421 domain-containing protein n=8 Tax=Bacillus cereus group TaxID=86661 RepID=A0A084IWP1_BACMY|nr:MULTISPECIES: DUF421 domain-containing protein [Bacillus]EEL03567.1 hypothetical protein bcere0014_48280 [Bacillus cereus BDRD-ST196]EJQ65339.1 hypothetical protein IG7_04872 [Bacillus cereus HuA2-4]EJS00577.1 hypothetical protein IKO_04362 [Bacillus cereus VDM034]EJS16516.1 hypothetical protein IKS_00651 [Bacillus cereus VDM062]MBK5514343.1 DUF421 domain-containing protein [Bacillus sp. TH11]RAN89681.1 hypothetical protein B5P41_11155 [Bacillus sp. SRB_28]